MSAGSGAVIVYTDTFDNFERSLPGGLGNMEWGTATPSGYIWQDDPYSASADFWVSNGNGAAYTAYPSAPGMSVDNLPAVAGDFTMTAQVRPYVASSGGTLGYTYAFRVLAGNVGDGYLNGSFYCRIDGYNTTLSGPAVSLTKGTNFPTVTSAAFDLSFEAWYMLKWQREGSTHRMKLWLNGTTEPVDWLLEQVDIPSFASGRFGYAMQGRNDTELDIAWIDFDYGGAPVVISGR